MLNSKCVMVTVSLLHYLYYLRTFCIYYKFPCIWLLYGAVDVRIHAAERMVQEKELSGQYCCGDLQ